MTTHKSLRAFAMCSIILASCTITAQAADQYKLISAPADLQWFDTGPQFPNTHVTLLEGDPGKEGPVTLRWHCPANYKFMPHTHPGPERVTVLSGAMLVGVGPKYDVAQLKEVRQGGYIVLPGDKPHYGECKGETTIEIHTTGPLGTTYMDPADDPSKTH